MNTVIRISGFMTAALLLSAVTFSVISCSEKKTDEPLMIFAASDLRYAMEDLKTEFLKQYPDARVETVYGSSGKAYSQLQNSAPYDLYFSANMEYPLKLKEKGLTVGDVYLYALGYIVIWSRAGSGIDVSEGYEILKSPKVKKIAIANPEHAPYGVAAKQALKKHGVWEAVQSKLVMGENISQTAQFASSGAADAGIIAWSLALAPDLKKLEGSIYRIDPADHEELRQGFTMIKKEKEHPYARKFASFVRTAAAKEILKKYGFEVPADHE